MVSPSARSRYLLEIRTKTAWRWLGAWAKRQGVLTMLGLFRRVRALMREGVLQTQFAATYPLVMEVEKLVKISENKLQGLAKKNAIKPALIEKVVVRSGTPFNEISKAARELRVDVIIISTHGHTGLKHLLLGSTTERVVRHADCPVFVVREEEREIIQPTLTV